MRLRFGAKTAGDPWALRCDGREVDAIVTVNEVALTRVMVHDQFGDGEGPTRRASCGEDQ